MFSPLSEAIVLFSAPAVLWHLLWIMSVGGASLQKRIIACSIVIAWTGLAYTHVRYDLGDGLWAGTPFAAAVPAVSLGIVALMGFLFRDQILGTGVPQRLLIALQLFRPIGMIFVLENMRGTLPGSFAHPAGWGDLIAGLVAAYVLIRYWDRDIPARAVVLVAVVGLADFASAFFFGATCAATPFQLFAFDNPNRVLDYPLGLIPMFLVPYAVVAHILSLAQLRRDQSI